MIVHRLEFVLGFAPEAHGFVASIAFCSQPHTA